VRVTEQHYARLSDEPRRVAIETVAKLIEDATKRADNDEKISIVTK
jgi:hypothetical protein